MKLKMKRIPPTPVNDCKFQGDVRVRPSAGHFRQFEPLRSHLSQDRARFAIGRNLRQLQAMGGEGDVLLSFVD
jgi:hypothetical protein